MNVFDYDAQWLKVLYVLDNPLALRALNAGMTSWCDEGGKVWEPDRGPWAFSRGDGWYMDAQAKFEESDQYTEWQKWCKAQGCPDYEHDPAASDEWYDTQKAWDKYGELEAAFYPQPRTPDWYRCWGACHWIAVWNCVIGELLFPDMEWCVIKAKEHSTAIGVNRSGEVCMDILWGKDHTSAEIWDAIHDGEWDTLMDEIEWQETRPYARSQ